jgi:hypothetical protein
MYRRKITYTNFNDEQVTETLAFNLSETELLDLSEQDPTFSAAYLKQVADEQDPATMFRLLRKTIALSYGEVSMDGKRFMKSEEIMNGFLHSAAYDALIRELVSSDSIDEVSSMLIGIFPAQFRDELTKASKNAVAAKNTEIVTG